MNRLLAILAAALAMAALAGCASSDAGGSVPEASGAPETMVLEVADRAVNSGAAGSVAGSDEAVLARAATARGGGVAAAHPDLKLDDIDDNVFLDALAYTGYDLQKHRSDGMMWTYVLWTDKEWRGWLSGITYDGGATGMETNDEGKPDLDFFRQTGLVCASYASYVYFNYLPNVAGVDTSMLERPSYSQGADSWYQAAKAWVAAGYSRTIDWQCEENSNWLTFTEAEEIPIGSLVFFTDGLDPSDYASHVAIYAGYRDGYHWLTHVGNSNGPEFCAIERMHFGEDPQWPLAVITRPNVL